MNYRMVERPAEGILGQVLARMPLRRSDPGPTPGEDADQDALEEQLECGGRDAD